GEIVGDAKQPGRDARRRLVLGRAEPEAEERLLGDVLRVGGVAHDLSNEVMNSRGMTSHELLVGALVAPGDGEHELRIARRGLRAFPIHGLYARAARSALLSVFAAAPVRAELLLREHAIGVLVRLLEPGAGLGFHLGERDLAVAVCILLLEKPGESPRSFVLVDHTIP